MHGWAGERRCCALAASSAPRAERTLVPWTAPSSLTCLSSAVAAVAAHAGPDGRRVHAHTRWVKGQRVLVVGDCCVACCMERSTSPPPPRLSCAPPCLPGTQACAAWPSSWPPLWPPCRCCPTWRSPCTPCTCVPGCYPPLRRLPCAGLGAGPPPGLQATASSPALPCPALTCCSACAPQPTCAAPSAPSCGTTPGGAASLGCIA